MKNLDLLHKCMVMLFLVTSVLYSVDFVYGDSFTKDEFQMVSLGERYSSVIKSDGSLWVWGTNNCGQLGNGTYIKSETPIKIMDNVVSVSLGNLHSSVIKSDGSLWTWGLNFDGQLGVDTAFYIPSPVKIMDNVVSASLGTNYSSAIKSDGSLWTWGKNGDGQLGDGTRMFRDAPVKIMDNVVAVSIKYQHSAAIQSDGSLWTWGWNGGGQLGNGTDHYSLTPIKIMDNVVAVSLGNFHSSALKSDGSLWMWGLNEVGQLGDGTYENSTIPMKIMDNVVAVSLGYANSSAIQSDGSLWTWGWNKFNQLGDGTKVNRNIPVKIMDNIVSMSLGYSHSSAIQSDGSLWTWGWNLYDQLGDGTAQDKLTPVKIMDNIMLPSTTPINSLDEYDASDLGASIVLPIDNLMTITNQETAVVAAQSALKVLTEPQKHSVMGTDLITLYAEESVALSGNLTMVGSNVNLNQNNLSTSAKTSNATQKDIENILTSSGVTLARRIGTAVTIYSTDEKKTEVTIESSAALVGVDELRITSPTYSISIPSTLVQSRGQDGFKISIEVQKSDEVGTKYEVSIDKPLTDNIKLSLTPLAGDPTFQAVFKVDGTVVGGKYNPVTGKMDVCIKASDTYTIRNNPKDFSDIQNKPVEMQNAIRVLASKGIISGTSQTTFSPDSSITRAEIAALVLRTLSKLNPEVNGNFEDVKAEDWYYGVAGSAKEQGIMNGLNSGLFAPNSIILKEQIVAVVVRALKNEMKYKDLTGIDAILSTYKDRASLPSWGLNEIALATKENMVVKRSDLKFMPKESMSRGDAAEVLYQLFSRLW